MAKHIEADAEDLKWLEDLQNKIKNKGIKLNMI